MAAPLVPTAGRAICSRGVDSGAVACDMVWEGGQQRQMCISASIFLAVVGPLRDLSLCGNSTRANHGGNMLHLSLLGLGLWASCSVLLSVELSLLHL